MTKLRLSASRIDTYRKCSWLYDCKYIKRIPDETSEALGRGSATHDILEFLLTRKDLCIEIGSNINNSPEAKKFFLDTVKKYRVADLENMKSIHTFVLAALNNDFFCEGAELKSPELTFDITNEEPSYRIMGFMDKVAIYDSKHPVVHDYKTSKQKFSQSAIEFNVQGLTYMLACRHLFPGSEVARIVFQFLRYKKKINQDFSASPEHLDGFEYYISHIGEVLETWGPENAVEDFAWNDYKRRYICNYMCQYRDPFDYWVILDEKGEIKTTLKEEPREIEAGQTVEKRSYGGCPMATAYEKRR